MGQRKYCTDNFTITEDYISLYSKKWGFESKSDALDDISEKIESFASFLKNDMDSDIKKAVTAINYHEPNPTHFLPEKPLTDYTLNMLDHYLGLWIGEFENEQEYDKVLNDEKTAFVININSHLDMLAYHREDIKNPEKLRDTHRLHNDMLLEISEDENLRNKLEGKENNNFLKFLRSSTRFMEGEMTRTLFESKKLPLKPKKNHLNAGPNQDGITKYNPQSFEQLFISPHDTYVDKYLDILRKYAIPNEDAVLAGIKHKGWVRAFYDICIEEGIIYHFRKSEAKNLKYIPKTYADPLFQEKFKTSENFISANKSDKRISGDIEQFKSEIQRFKKNVQISES